MIGLTHVSGGFGKEQLSDICKEQTKMDTLHRTGTIMKKVTESTRMSGFAGIILNTSVFL